MDMPHYQCLDFPRIPSTSHLSEPFLQRNQTSSSLVPLVRGLALGILSFVLVFAAFLVLSKCSSGRRELAHPFWAEAQTRYGYANGNFFIAPCSDFEPWFGEPSARPRPNSR